MTNARFHNGFLPYRNGKVWREIGQLQAKHKHPRGETTGRTKCERAAQNEGEQKLGADSRQERERGLIQAGYFCSCTYAQGKRDD